MMKLVLPAHPSGDFKVFVDGKDITESLCVRKVSVRLESGQPLIAELECYIDKCDLTVMPENVVIAPAELKAEG